MSGWDGMGEDGGGWDELVDGSRFFLFPRRYAVIIRPGAKIAGVLPSRHPQLPG